MKFVVNKNKKRYEMKFKVNNEKKKDMVKRVV